ncbi:Uncharacterised protein [Chryseobacterium gleum]|uniref:Uncharacterized protein n=2 Tax=Chryseobacterium gleum TaxID=250 RepID=A0A3S4MS99_CHRGE|nr:hypothetical protein [Chryseobacterium gleum]EFK38086.1 hypothetical protein HMPREF0204_10032 [Chryseobacterium gleum ATCC 35910]QQY32411.1 hypothetical protein I6I60_01040 [Chryseobacterium gleum]VEE10377.1 Uncharacterised protein [Chryseobacterium gleum]
MRKIKFSPLGEKTFLISFLLGTSLLLLFWITRAEFLIVLGFYYVMIAAVVNLLITLYELMEFLSDISGKKRNGNSVLLLLLNIPIALIYFIVYFEFLSNVSKF